MGWLRVYPDSPDWGNIPGPSSEDEKKDDDGQEDEKEE